MIFKILIKIKGYKKIAIELNIREYINLLIYSIFKLF